MQYNVKRKTPLSHRLPTPRRIETDTTLNCRNYYTLCEHNKTYIHSPSARMEFNVADAANLHIPIYNVP